MTSAEAATTRPELPHLSMPRQRTRSIGFWVSLAVHAALVALIWTRRDLLVPTPRPGDPRFGDLGGGGGGGGGGERVTYIIALPPVAPPVAVAPAVVPPVVTPPKVDAPVVTPAPVTAPDTVVARPPSSTPGEGTSPGAGSTPGSGGGSGGGQGTGVGAGNGPGSGSGAGGEGGGIRPPELRGLAIPFSTPPKELRGKEVKVTFAVTADGRVDRFETDPVITNRGYYQKFAEAALGYRFRPARGPDGQPVAAVLVMYFTLPTQ